MINPVTFSRNNTKTRILIAASRVFAEKGYKNTTVQDICSASEANIAAVNYHYKSKENLYRIVWDHLYKFNEQANEELFRDDLDPKVQLKHFVSTRIKSTLDNGELGYLSKLISYELNSPTTSYDHIYENYLKERINWVLRLIDRLTKGKLDQSSKEQIFFLVNSPIIRLNETIMNNNKFIHHSTLRINDELIDNMYNYILGGIYQICIGK